MKESIYKFVLVAFAVVTVFGVNMNVLALSKAPPSSIHPQSILPLSRGEIKDFIDKIHEKMGFFDLNTASWSPSQIKMNGDNFKYYNFKNLITSHFITIKELKAPSNHVSVPEPSYMILLGIFLLVLLTFKRKRFLK